MKIQPLPAVSLVVLVSAVVAIIFLAPPENTQAALASTSILGLVIQGLMRSVVSGKDP